MTIHAEDSEQLSNKFEEVELDPDADEPEDDGVASERAGRFRFLIDNDNDATTIKLKAVGAAPIQRVIDKMYVEIGRSRLPGDRLTRASDGSDVFESAHLSVADYAGKTPAQKRRWDFVGEPGGASR